MIVTTLAARSYEQERDLFSALLNTVRRMPTHIENRNGRWWIPNPAHPGENFADKWNQDPRLAVAFYNWHKSALTSIETLLDLEGADRLGRQLQDSFGVSRDQVRGALAPLTEPVERARAASSLFVAPALGVVPSPSTAGVGVRPNTFFGR